MAPTPIPTLTSADYCSEQVFADERRIIFHAGWFLALRADTLQRGNRRVIDVAGESILVARDLDDSIHAYANVCRHRGARLCESDSDSTQGSLMCPYHAWTYALDGRLISTPHLDADDVDKESMSLWAVAVNEWEGFVFVSLAKDPVPFDEWMQRHGQELTALQRYGFGGLRVAVTTVAEVHANWKIIVENYQECLHCTRVHPELVEIVPAYRTGWVYDPERPDGGVTLKDRGNSFSHSGTSRLPVLPGLDETDATSYFGATMFPNAFADVTGTSAIVTTMYPKGPALTTVVTEYMFAPDTIDDPGFDPSEVVDFSELVARQDFDVCERVQRGVSSSLFTTGQLTPKDDMVIGFVDHYRATMRAGSVVDGTP
jgi:glycine betaine catabolism A